jgi:hypothetical protein
MTLLATAAAAAAATIACCYYCTAMSHTAAVSTDIQQAQSPSASVWLSVLLSILHRYNAALRIDASTPFTARTGTPVTIWTPLTSSLTRSACHILKRSCSACSAAVNVQSCNLLSVSANRALYAALNKSCWHICSIAEGASWAWQHRPCCAEVAWLTSLQGSRATILTLAPCNLSPVACIH